MTCVTSHFDFPPFKNISIEILLDVGFGFQKRKRLSVIIERDDIILSRRGYLGPVLQLRSQNQKIYFWNETWVADGHVTNNVRVDSTVKQEVLGRTNRLLSFDTTRTA
jgi:hypothetical protein